MSGYIFFRSHIRINQNLAVRAAHMILSSLQTLRYQSGTRSRITKITQYPLLASPCSRKSRVHGVTPHHRPPEYSPATPNFPQFPPEKNLPRPLPLPLIPTSSHSSHLSSNPARPRSPITASLSRERKPAKARSNHPGAKGRRKKTTSVKPP